MRSDERCIYCRSGVLHVEHLIDRSDNGWRPERVGECDRCHVDELELCETPGEGMFDYCAPCWRAAGIRMEV